MTLGPPTVLRSVSEKNMALYDFTYLYIFEVSKSTFFRTTYVNTMML
jgi:hypothetical protein